MSVGSKRNRKKFENVSIKINNVPIERVNHCKYLGVTIDTEWKPQSMLNPKYYVISML